MPIYQAPNLKAADNTDIKFEPEELVSNEYTITDMDLHTRKQQNIGKKGLKISRLFTKKGESPYATMNFDKRISRIINPDGTVVFEMKDVEVPDFWSQVATDILAQKYFRKRGVPLLNPDGSDKLDQEGKKILGSENSAKQTMHRLAGTWRYWGEKYGYFETSEDAQAFEDEIKYMLMNQMAVPNSPQWFNTGLHWAYGITGEAQGHYYMDPDTGKLTKSTDAYSRPQPHACFIQEVQDDLVNEGGIFDLLTKEARLFKYGSGTGTNFSKLRSKGELLAGGGSSSGLMSFLKVLDTGAGAIQSGGTTRRAAKMVILDVDHPEIETFIDWKVKEEEKVADLITGSHICFHHLKDIMQLAQSGGLDPDKNKELKAAITRAKEDYIPLNYIKRVLMLIENGIKVEDFDYSTFDSDFRSEAYQSVSGQNSNNSVRVTNAFIKAVENDDSWELINRTDGKVRKSIKARDLWKKIGYAAWSSADPGLQYHDTVNDWHTCLADGEIIGSNPCSEYMFLDETACNLYQINLLRFYDPEKAQFKTKEFAHCVRIATIILEISVLMSQLPSKTMAIGTFKYRTLGLGYANVGSLLMQMGLPYDSEEGFAMTAAVTAIMGGEAYAASAEMANILSPFERYEYNKTDMLRVIRNHRRAAYSKPDSDYEKLSVKPVKFRSELVDQNLVTAAKQAWDYALVLGEEYGYRNAQVTCIAPTGTSGLVMDCDTTGIEPDFALVKFKKLVGGGYFKIVNQSLIPALKNLGYPDNQIRAVVDYAIGKQSLTKAPHINVESLRQKGFDLEKIAAIEAVLPTVFELKYAFNKWILGEDFLINNLKISKSELNDFNFNVLEFLGFTAEQISEASEYICGTMTVEGAPFLKMEDYAVFDCANKCGEKGERFIAYTGHIRQMAAAQPFVSGAISKTINMPEEATMKEVEQAYLDSWKYMIKATALYRDGSKLSQPLSTSANGDSVYAKLFNFSDDEANEKEIEPEALQQVLLNDSQKPYRRKMPTERHSITHGFEVAGHEGYITVGLYEDGTPGEIFITMSKEGSTLSGITQALALSISLNLQYGVPLETIVRKFSHMRFEPSGMTKNSEIPMAKSLVDYIARWLGVKFLDKNRAKLYHDSELVEKAYSKAGSHQRVTVPIIQENKPGLIKFTNSAEILLEEKISVTTGPSLLKSNQPAASLTEFSKIQQQMAYKLNNEDAPMCSNCGSVTTRNGSCYKCPDCGTTTGCS